MINQTVLVGRLVADVELRYTQSGTAVCQFRLAVDRNYTNQQGERETDFINCVMWRKTAENFSNFTHKGSLVGITGSIQTRTYDNQQGQKVYVTEVLAENFQLLEPRNQSQTPPQQRSATPAQNTANRTQQGQTPPQSQPQTNTSGSAAGFDPSTFDPSDLPF